MKEKKSGEFSLHLFLVGIVAIVAVVALVLHGNGTAVGASVNKVVVEDWQDACVDDDPKNDRLKPGTVKYGRIEYVDSCSDGILLQYECSSERSVKAVDGRRCTDNLCKNGACLK